MPEQKDQTIEERIESLEQIVEKLTYTIDRMQDRLASMDANRPIRPTDAPSVPDDISANGNSALGAESVHPDIPLQKQREGNSSRPMYSVNSESWLNKIGLGLLFVGLALAFKYSIDQFWFTPIVRVFFGAFVGVVLLVAGLSNQRRRPRIAQFLLGGCVVTFYVVTFAAYQLDELIPFWLAYASMLAITVFSYLLSVQRDDTVLAILATLGGLVTPFIMHSEGGSLPALISYTSLILVGSAAIYWFRGWRILLFISSIGAWLVVLICSLNFGFRIESVAADRWTLQTNIMLSWILFWAMPVVRGMLRSKNPSRWPAPPQVKAVGYFLNHPALPLSVTTPILTLVFSMLIWDLSDNLWGWIILEASAIYGFLYLYIRGHGLNHLAQMQGLIGTVFLTVGLFHLFDDYSFMVALAAEAALIRLLSRTMTDRLLSFVSHGLFIAICLWLVQRLLSLPVAGLPMLNVAAFSELTVILLGLTMAFLMKREWMSSAYLIGGHILILGWLFRELGALSDGQAVVTISWGLYAIVLLFFAIRKRYGGVRTVALSTLAIVVFKLFLVDLAEVDALIRVLLFVGFGVVFMALSYLLPSVFKRKVKTEQQLLEEEIETASTAPRH